MNELNATTAAIKEAEEAYKNAEQDYQYCIGKF